GRARLALVVAGLALLAASPKLDRLTAAVADAVSRTTPLGGPESVDPPALLEEPLAETTHFLPTPRRVTIPRAADGTYPTLAAALSRDGSRLALADGPAVVVWDVWANRVLFSLSGHAEAINAIAFSPDGSRVVTVSNDTHGIIW